MKLVRLKTAHNGANIRVFLTSWFCLIFFPALGHNRSVSLPLIEFLLH